MFAAVTPGAEFLFYGLLVLTALAFLFVLVTNPKLFIEIMIQQRETNAKQAEIFGKAVTGAASIVKPFIKK
jgi:hypothetical protein